jgi:hypothetical protein
MTDKLSPRLDERLADFTDRLLAGEIPERPAASAPDRELEQLQETVRLARRAFRVADPDPALRNRIRTRLAAEWQRSGPPAPAGQTAWLSARKRRQVWLFRLAAVTAGLALLAALLAPRIETVLPGAAEDKTGVGLLIAAGLSVLVLILFWISRKP